MNIAPNTVSISKGEKATVSTLNIKNTSMAALEESGAYINCNRIYFAYHEAFPSTIALHNINHEKAIKWVESQQHARIIHRHHRSRTLDKAQKAHYINVIYVLTDELLIDIENNGVVAILFSAGSESAAKEMEVEIRKFKRPKSHGTRINLLIQGTFGLDLMPIKNKKPNLEIALHYNDDLEEVHKNLVQTLNAKQKSGLVLLHGMPGTGKSTYIRYLLYKIKKKVIFLPPRIAGDLDSPNMTSLLVENPNSIFIIEDAEQLIKSREGSAGSNLSMLLNLTDGMLGVNLGIQVICTFNTSVNNIDSALMRKGRLSVMYEFKKLSKEKTTQLFTKLKKTEFKVNEEMTLADIFNKEQSEFTSNSTKPIGFF